MDGHIDTMHADRPGHGLQQDHGNALMADTPGSPDQRIAALTEALRESQLRFRQLAENIHEVFYLVTADFSRVLYASPGYEAVWGGTCDALQADPLAWERAILTEDRARVRRGPQGFDLRYRVRRADGEVRWIHDRGFPIADANGVIYRVAGIAEDITVRVTMEMELKAQGERLRHAQKVARLGHVVTDAYGGFVSWSETLPEMIGTVDGVMPRSTRMWLDLVDPLDREQVRAKSIESARTGKPMHLEYRLRRKDGTWTQLRQVAEPIADGAPLGLTTWFSTIQDITEQKRAEDERHESDRRFTEMMDRVQLVSIMLDRLGRITYCNDYLLDLTGWQRLDVIGADYFKVFAEGDPVARRKRYDGLLAGTRSSEHLEAAIRTRSGESRMVRWNSSVLRSASGEVIGVASIGEDITDRRRAEEEVSRLNTNLEQRVLARTAELEAANRELEAYDYSISHDLRAPLNRIEGFSAALLEDCSERLGPDGRDHLQRISRAAETLSQMVTDVLRLSTWNRVGLNRTSVDMGAMAEGVLSSLASAEPTRQVAWKVDATMKVDADPGLLRIALENLIGNAWKFSGKRHQAEIEVACELCDGEAVYRVRDNGAGFDPHEARDIFKPFRRLASSGQFQGSGVGLATVQRIVRRHGGHLWAEGRQGEGATFSFTLPAA